MILVCGEALIDLFVGPVEGAEMPARAVAGGSPFNVAVGLARLGVGASFLGGISRDRFGALLARTLVREGINDRFLVRTDRLSTISSRPTTTASRAMLFTVRARRTVGSRSPIYRPRCRRRCVH
jgi:fructokinase